jgi:hypothetical protein
MAEHHLRVTVNGQTGAEADVAEQHLRVTVNGQAVAEARRG